MTISGASKDDDEIVRSDADEPIGGPRKTSLLRSSAVMAAGTFLSRILGFVRWALLLIAIGGVGANDAFQAANTLPNMVFNLLAAGLLDAILVPQIVRALKTRSGSVYVNRLLTLAGLILFVMTIVMLAGANVLVTLTASQMAPEWKSLAVVFAWWCLPQIFFYGLYALLGEFLNARGIFGPYMWTPVANNVIGIAGILLYIAVYGTSMDLSDPTLWDFQRTAIIAVPSTLGVVVQALLLFIPLRRAGVKLRLDFHFRGTGLRSASTVTMWVFATLVVGQVGTLSTTNIASAANQWWQETGVFAPSTSALSYSFMVYMLPQSIVSISIAAVLFTRMAASAADNDHQALVEQYYEGVRINSLLVMWLAAVLAAGALPVFQALGPNNPIEHMQGYAQVLVMMLPSTIGASVILFSQRIFYALEDARPVFYTALGPTIVQVILGWSLMAVLPPTQWLLGAVFAESVSRVAQGVIAVLLVHKHLPQVRPMRIFTYMIRYSVFATVSALAGYGALRLVGTAHTGARALENFFGAAARGLLVFVVVTAVYFVVVAVFDRDTTARVASLLARRIPALARFAPAVEAGEDVADGSLQTGAGEVARPDGPQVAVADVAAADAGGASGADTPAPVNAQGGRPAQAHRRGLPRPSSRMSLGTASDTQRRKVASAVAKSQLFADLQRGEVSPNYHGASAVKNPHWHQRPTSSFDELVFGPLREQRNPRSTTEEE